MPFLSYLYFIYIFIYTSAICEGSCENGYCYAPNECKCYPGFIAQAQGGACLHMQQGKELTVTKSVPSK